MEKKHLSSATHELCRRALSGEFGRGMAEKYCATVPAENFDTLSPWEQYNACLEAIVEQCPIRLTDTELLAGSATLDKARNHQVPAALEGQDPEKQLFRSQSHLTPHYQKVLKKGLSGLEEEIERAMTLHRHHSQQLRRLTYYGSGDKAGDEMLQRLYDAYTHMIGKQKFYNGMLFPAGISTFGRQVTPEFLDNRTANPDGHKKGEFLSNNISPTPAQHLRGATAMLRFYGSLDMRKLPGGTALEIKLSHATVRGEEGVQGLVDLLYAFCQLGCHFMQPDVVDGDMLRRAQEDPETYGDLVVRVSGWSSRFRTLERQWQELVIQRTEMGY